jgi:Pentapeptide repeats (8 copies)
LKNNRGLDERITPDVFKLVAEYLKFEDENFNEHVKFLGLDPKNDFRFSDLSGVDLSGSNLCGFDFTGSDLRGATGANVQWDRTTILKGADTRDSLFAYRLQHDRFLVENPEVAKRINLLLNDYWPRTILGVEKLLNDRKFPYGRKVAQAVFDETEDIVVRSNVLLFMRLATDSAEEHRQFIFNVIARHGSEVTVVRAALRALASFYPDNKGALNIFKTYIRHEDETIHNEALNAIISSRHLVAMIQDIVPHLSGSKHGFRRRTMLARIAQTAGADYIAASRDTDFVNALDYEEPISERKMQSIAEAAILKERYDAIANEYGRLSRRYHEKRLQEALNVNYKKIHERASEYKGLLGKLRDRYGIPLLFETEKAPLGHVEPTNVAQN